MQEKMDAGAGLAGVLRPSCLWLAGLGLSVLLSGCGLLFGSGPRVVDNGEYARLIRLLPEQMQAQGLADGDLRYTDNGRPKDRYGEKMFRQLSPDFLVGEKAHDVYLGENFHRTRTPSSRVYPDRDGEGFAIVHPSQRLAMRMLALVDWNGDGTRDWLMRCTVESFRGKRVRHYYVLAPEPEDNALTHGTILASVDENGLAAPVVQVRDIADYGRKHGDLPLTDVKEGLPGDMKVTEPPSAPVESGGVQEREI